MEGDLSVLAESWPNEPVDDPAWLLDRIDTFQRRPRGLKEAWQAAQQDEANSTAAIFLSRGKLAWLAYYLSKTASEQPTHFAGQGNLRRKISALEEKPQELQLLIAGKVAAGVTPDAQNKIERWLDMSHRQRAGKRKRVPDDGYCPPTTTREGSSPTSITSSTGSPEPERQPRRLAHLDFGTSDNYAEYEHVLVNASLAETIRLLPPPLSDAIKRIPDPENGFDFVASIAMSFPNVRSKFGCQMTLEIMENKIDNLARDLFETRLEITAGLRYVCLSEGAKILPNPKLTLQGCRHDVIPAIFGTEIHGAIAASPAYQDDIKQKRARTDCVWMVISHKAKDKADICVSMGLVEGTRIRGKLYK